jgi:signal transduction histidine kinase
MLREFNRNISIKRRIYFGFSGAILGLIIASVVTVYSISQVQSNSKKLDDINEEVTSIIKLNNIISQLKRTVSIYIYTGQDSISRSASRLILDVKKTITELNVTHHQSYQVRLSGHLENYSKTFQQAIIEYNLKKKLISDTIPNLLNKLKSRKHKSSVNKIESLIWIYLDSPSTKASDETRRQINLLTNKLSSPFKVDAKKLGEGFLRLTQATRSYLYLINVVMAGEALEFEYVATEMKQLSITFGANLKETIENRNQNIKIILTFFLIVSIIALSYYSWLIASGISHPLETITETLKRISAGELDILIPEQDRNDEIGTLSQAADTFRERSQRLNNSNDELSQFAYRTSHDLKAPLVSIIGITEVIKDDLEDQDYEEVKVNIDKIASSAKKLEELIGDILQLSKADHLQETISTVNLYEVSKSIEEKLDNLFKDNKIAFHFEGLKGKTIQCQSTRLEQVLENLISNAIKYCDPDKQQRYVKVSMVVNNDKPTLLIEDNGLGIDQKYQSDLFGMFKRFHTNIAFGSGLGLYLVKKHIEKLDASISVESKKGVGSTFVINFS